MSCPDENKLKKILVPQSRIFMTKYKDHDLKVAFKVQKNNHNMISGLVIESILKSFDETFVTEELSL
jgi:hypothetical protein